MKIEETRILIVDDEPDMADMVKELLQSDGFLHIHTAADCRNAKTELAEGEFHLILLDVMLPDGNGFELYKTWKERMGKDTPVIFLSARDEDEARLKGLGLGADDYITKPFLPEELLLRVRAVLRRVYTIHDKDDRLILKDVSIDWDRGMILKDGAEQSLTAKEYVLLRKLADHKGKIVTIDALCDTLWPDGAYGFESSLMVHIRHIRKKLETDPSKPVHLVTARGLGYRLE